MGTFSAARGAVAIGSFLLGGLLTPGGAEAQSTAPSSSLPTPEEAAAADAPDRGVPEGGEAVSESAPADGAEDAEDAEDEGKRFRAFYLEASAGYSWINLGAIRNDNLVPDLMQIRSSGYAFGAGFGLWIKFITLGLQAEVARHDGFDFGTAVLDLGIRIPTPFIEPYIRAGLGFAWLFNPSGGLFEDASGVVWEGEQAIRGVVLDVGLGFDFIVSDLVAIGIGADASLFNVRRAGAGGLGRAQPDGPHARGRRGLHWDSGERPASAEPELLILESPPTA